MSIIIRGHGHSRLDPFRARDLTTWKRHVAYVQAVVYGGGVSL